VPALIERHAAALHVRGGRFGGRNWTVVSAALLLVPCFGVALLLRPGVSYTRSWCWPRWPASAAALRVLDGQHQRDSTRPAEGLGPRYQRRRGNLWRGAVQLVGLLVLAIAGAGSPRLVAGVYLPLIVIARCWPP